MAVGRRNQRSNREDQLGDRCAIQTGGECGLARVVVWRWAGVGGFWIDVGSGAYRTCWAVREAENI